MTASEKIFALLGAGYGFNGLKEEAIRQIDKLIGDEIKSAMKGCVPVKEKSLHGYRPEKDDTFPIPPNDTATESITTKYVTEEDVVGLIDWAANNGWEYGINKRVWVHCKDTVVTTASTVDLMLEYKSQLQNCVHDWVRTNESIPIEVCSKCNRANCIEASPSPVPSGTKQGEKEEKTAKDASEEINKLIETEWELYVGLPSSNKLKALLFSFAQKVSRIIEKNLSNYLATPSPVSHQGTILHGKEGEEEKKNLLIEFALSREDQLAENICAELCTVEFKDQAHIAQVVVGLENICKKYAALAVKWPTPQEYLGALYTECTEAMTPLAQAEAMIKWLRNR